MKKIMFVIFVLCNTFIYSQSLTNNIKGNWYYCKGNDTIQIFKFIDGLLEIKHPKLSFEVSYEFINGKIVECRYYEIEKSNGEYFLNVLNQDKDLLSKYFLYYFQNEMVLVNTKFWIEDICLHIDEINYLVREGFEKSDSIPYQFITTKYYIPENFRGKIEINYDQPDGNEKEYDDAGNRILNIPPSGFIKTKFEVDPVSFIYNKLEFYFKSENKVKKVNYIPYTTNCYKYLDKSKYEIHNDSVLVISHGFNQSSRRIFNTKYNEQLKGNIETIEIIEYGEFCNKYAGYNVFP